jgi:hypothetical protein
MNEGHPDIDALADQYLHAYERTRRRRTVMTIQLAFMLVVPFVLGLVWLLFVGHQRHLVEIRLGELTLRITSHRSPFEVYSDPDEFAKPTEGGAFVQIKDEVSSKRVESRFYEWASVATTEQRVTLPPGTATYKFFVNTIPFNLDGDELQSGERRWLLRPGAVVEIDVDQIEPPKPAPPNSQPRSAGRAVPAQ